MDKHKTKCEIAWQKFLYVIVVDIDRKKSEVIVCAAQFELAQSLGNFIPTPQPSDSVNGTQSGTDTDRGRVIHTLRFQVNNCHSASILSSNVVENVDRGFCHPCILLKARSIDKRNGEYTSLHLVHLTEAGLKLKGYFQIEQRPLNEDPTAHFDILNESVISVVVSGEIHLIRFKDPRKASQMCKCNVTNVLQKSTSKKISHSSLKILGFKTIHRNNNENSDTFCDILWLVSVETKKSASHDPVNPWELQSPNKTIAVLITLLQDHSYRASILDGTDFLPNIYGSLVTDLQIISAGEHSKKSDAAQPRIGAESEGSIQMESTVLISTTAGQLLYFRNGDLKRCMSIELGAGLKMVQFENCIGASYYLLQNTDSIAVVDAQSFEVAERFSNITSVHVADFAGSGGDQVLLVPKQEALASPNNWTKFILTDFHSWNIRSSQTDSTSEEGAPDASIQAAVQALEGRLQASVTYVCGVEREFENKLRLVEQSVATLKQLALGRETVHIPQPGLMPLLGEESTAGARRDEKCPDVAVDTLSASDLWHRVYNDFWCLSMVLLNTSKRCLESLKLSLIPHHSKPQQQPIESTTSFTQTRLHAPHPSTPSTSDEPTPKLRRLHSHHQQHQHPLVPHWSLEPSGRVQCVIKTAVPSFSSGDARRVTVMASWVESDRVTVGMEIGEMGTFGEGDGVYGRGSACCCAVAQVELSASDVLSGSLHVQPEPSMSAEDLLVLDVTQTCYPLTVTRSYSSSGNISHTLQKALQFQRLSDSESWICLQGGCLQHARVEVISSVHINVHVRDESQLFLLVHALYSVLPDDVIIVPRHTSDVTALTTNLLSDITAETDFIRDNSQSLLVKSHKVPIPEVENGECKKDKITSVRREFAQKQQQVLSAGDATIDEQKLKQFQMCLHRLEKRTNESMGALSSRLGSVTDENH